MKCVRCGMMIRGADDYYICDDCLRFSSLISEIFNDAHTEFETRQAINPDSHPIFRLLADSTFLTTKNPQTAIFYKLSDYIISRAFANEYEISEDDLNRNVMTTRAWSDIFKVFQELNLISVRLERYRRVLVLTDKTRKFALQYVTADNLVDVGLRTRYAQIYAGYVLIYILNKVAHLRVDLSNKSEIPYGQVPRTLWTVLMYLWTKAYLQETTFSEGDFIDFVKKRRMTSATRGRIMNALQAMDGRITQGLIKSIQLDDGEMLYEFDDYIINELERIRVNIRERENE